MLENAAYDFGSLSHVPPHGPCGAFGAGQPWAPNARSRDPLDKRGLVSGLVRKCVVLRDLLTASMLVFSMQGRYVWPG